MFKRKANPSWQCSYCRSRAENGGPCAHRYLRFEGRVTWGVQKLFDNEPDDKMREHLRKEVLRQRIWARKTASMMGIPIPSNITFEKPQCVGVRQGGNTDDF